MSAGPRAVVDTNLVVSALIFGKGRLVKLRSTWQGGQFHPLVSKSTATELLRVLAYPEFELTEAKREDLLADYLPYCTTVKLPSRRPAVPECRDPFDVPFLELSLAGKADYLVTGDKDLLSLAAQLPVPIVRAEAFLNALPAKP
ncbi:MAG: putative toxin-antitoxin system toxin component, PIN family [Gammaproteobacteria bacterium]